jgi:hypothetical protein
MKALLEVTAIYSNNNEDIAEEDMREDHYVLGKEVDLPFPPFIGLRLCFDTLYSSLSPTDLEIYSGLRKQRHATITGIFEVETVNYYVDDQECLLSSYFLYDRDGATEEEFLRSLEILVIGYGFKRESEWQEERVLKRFNRLSDP